MIDFFDIAGISDSGNTITVKGSNMNQPNDELTLVLSQGSYSYISQNFATTVSNDDALSRTVNYMIYDVGETGRDSSYLVRR